MQEKKLKILYIITKGSPYGGAQKYVYDLATRLPRDKFELVVLVGNGDELLTRLQNVDRKMQHPIRIIQIPEMGRDINLANEWKAFWQLVEILKSEKPDIVHLNSSKASGLGALACRFVNLLNFFVLRNSYFVIQPIFTVHGWAFNERRNLFSLLIIRFLSWITVLLSHKTIVISKSEEMQAMAMPFVKGKIELVYNGIEPIDFKNKNESREILLPRVSRELLDSKGVWIGTIAELHKNKNLSALIQAIKEIREKVILIIIGEGEERKKLEKIIKEHNLNEKVFLVGKVENAATLLKAFDTFVLPSIKEGLPYTLLEAGLAGLPCLSTYVGGIPEIIRNNVSGILVEPTTEKICNGLEFLITHPDKAKEFGKILKEKVQSDFSLQKMVEETIKIYREN